MVPRVQMCTESRSIGRILDKLYQKENANNQYHWWPKSRPDYTTKAAKQIFFSELKWGELLYTLVNKMREFGLSSGRVYYA